MTTLMRSLIPVFLICVVIMLACGMVASLAHLGYMRSAWVDVAYGWGVAAGIIGLPALVILASSESDHD